jgi:ABC-type nitrate/sulfonate/bicarbonate transport system ATPase subunit
MLINKDEKLFKEVIALVGLEGYEDHYPNNNSTAFRFRIALGRAIAAQANTIILDEPFSKSIKPETLERIYQLILSLKSELKLTIILGTSNLSESILLSDKIYLMKKNPGRVFDHLDISFEQNRNVELMTSKKFIEYRSIIEEKMKSEPSQILSNISV